MRDVFDDRLGNLRGAPPERFVWDYWHVADQYTYIRTFADEFFPPELYRRFLDRLLAWGRENLSCTKIVRPWLSYYVDGCRQEMHADVPHGPWAYVFSLTNWDGTNLHRRRDLPARTGDARPLARSTALGGLRARVVRRADRAEVQPAHRLRPADTTWSPPGGRNAGAARQPHRRPQLVLRARSSSSARRSSEPGSAPLSRRCWPSSSSASTDVDDLEGLVAARVDVSARGEVTST